MIVERGRSSLLTVGRSMMEPSDRYVSTSPNLPHQHELVSNSYTDVGDGGKEGNFHITSSDCRSLQLMSRILNVVDWKDKMREVCPIRRSVRFVS